MNRRFQSIWLLVTGKWYSDLVQYLLPDSVSNNLTDKWVRTSCKTPIQRIVVGYRFLSVRVGRDRGDGLGLLSVKTLNLPGSGNPVTYLTQRLGLKNENWGHDITLSIEDLFVCFSSGELRIPSKGLRTHYEVLVTFCRHLEVDDETHHSPFGGPNAPEGNHRCIEFTENKNLLFYHVHEELKILRYSRRRGRLRDR